ncbi:MAG: carboxypeptidase regulatory-like domain-containing protein [Lewinellaceae bacterium]|nr:carboxypeptidase regulatory-like domain-containing protein [Lewinellaceae bacterium]
MEFQSNAFSAARSARFFCLKLLLLCTLPAVGQTISGQARTEAGQGIEDVTVTVNGPGVSVAAFTNNSGNFTFTDLPTGQNYELCLLKNNDALNGVSTFDQNILSKHILDIEPLTSPYKIIAGEVGTENLPPDVLDLYLSRQVILGVYQEFPATSWKFIPADFVFPDPLHPFAYPFPQGCKIVTLSGNAFSQDFIAIKTADVNGGAVPGN